MTELTEAQRAAIVTALSAKGATHPCPRCKNQSFAVVGGYFMHPIQLNLRGISIGGPSVPTAVVVCSNCGWIAEHALGTLGLLPAEEKKPEDQK